MTASAGTPILVYDVGGSHVSAAICADRSCRVGKVVSAPHPMEQSSGAFLDLLCSIGAEAAGKAHGLRGAMLAVPGPFDFAAGVSLMRHKLPYLYGVNLRGQLASRFGWKEAQVGFLHDAAAFLLGEIAAGAARGVSRVVGITLGTGIGSAFAVDGRLLTDGHGVPPGGEIWNLAWEDGILEDYLSSRAIQENYRRHNGASTDVADIAVLSAHDSAAAAAMTEFGSRLGSALGSILKEFAPDIVVLGGGICRSAHLFLAAAEAQLDSAGFSLQVSALGDRAPLVGAAAAWFDADSRRPADDSLLTDAGELR
jgi:glucokinase